MSPAHTDEVASILVVDDVPANLTALDAVLEPLGQRVVRATSGREALKALLEEEFACILLDVQMPDLDGFETAKLIKARERTRHVPILFITAFAHDELNVGRGYEEGAVDYIVKPFNPDILRTKVAVFVDLFLQLRRLRTHEALMRDREREVMEREARERMQAPRRGRPLEQNTDVPTEALLASAPMPMALVRPDGRLLSLNPAFAELLRGRAESLRGRRLTDVGANAFENGVKQVLHSGEPFRDSVGHRLPGGELGKLDVTFKRVRLESDGVAVAIFVDVHRPSEREPRWADEEAGPHPAVH